jgi:DNA repair protein RadC
MNVPEQDIFGQGSDERTRGSSAERPEKNPYQEFLSLDPLNVQDELLVAVILAGTTGSRSPRQVAREALVATRGNLDLLSNRAAVSEVSGVGDAARAKLLAAAELYRRSAYRERAGKDEPISSPYDAASFLRTLAYGPEERLVAIYLNQRRIPIHTHTLGIGSNRFTVVDPMIVFRPAVELGAAGVIMAHNHPSGDPAPSQPDIDVTRRVAAAGRVLGCPLLDHLVIGKGARFTSLAEQGILPPFGDQAGHTGP